MWPACHCFRLRGKIPLIGAVFLLGFVRVVWDQHRMPRLPELPTLETFRELSGSRQHSDSTGFQQDEPSINRSKTYVYENEKGGSKHVTIADVSMPLDASPTADRSPRVILYWTPVFSRPDFDLGFGTAPFRGCPVSNCVATNNRSWAMEASAVLVHGRAIDMKDLPPRHSPHQLFVFALRESPHTTYLKSEVLAALDGFFNLTMTYKRDADVYRPIRITAPGSQEGTIPDFQLRNRTAAWLVSHCFSASGREHFVDDLTDFIDVDEYGLCGEQAVPPQCSTDPGFSEASLYRVIAQCYAFLARTHLFYLALENSLCGEYITEKFWFPLEVGMVPVVMGASREDYERVAPPGSFIHVDDFVSTRHLAEYLRYLRGNRTAYEEYFRWRQRFHVGEHRAACDLCARVHQRKPQQQVQLSQVWSIQTNCRPTYVSYTERMRSAGN